MSRIGNSPITIPESVEVKLEGQNINVKGPKGTLNRNIHENMKVTLEDKIIKVERPNDEKFNRSLHGLTRTLIANMIQGVIEEFKVELEINGVGLRASKQGKKLVMDLGYSHKVEMEEPTGVTVDVPSQTSIIVRGIDKEAVGQMAAEIRSKKLPEVYKGKGIKYIDEHIRRKEGKTGKK